MPHWLQAYVLIHFFAVCLVFQEFALMKGVGELFFTRLCVFLFQAYILIVDFTACCRE